MDHGQAKELGFFDDEQDAALAFDAESRTLGRNRLNFPTVEEDSRAVSKAESSEKKRKLEAEAGAWDPVRAARSSDAKLVLDKMAAADEAMVRAVVVVGVCECKVCMMLHQFASTPPTRPCSRSPTFRRSPRPC